MWLTVLLPALALAAVSSAAEAQTRTLVLRNAHVIDGLGQRPQLDRTIIIRDGRISEVKAAPPAHSTDARVIDLRGRWVLPGLIDAHVHFYSIASARRALQAGVTTARSLGGDHFADVGLSALHKAGASDIPEVIAAGYQVRRRLSDAFFLDFPSLRQLEGGVSGADGVRQVIEADVSRGVAIIKVLATERAGLVETDFRRRNLNDQELASAVREAARFGLQVAAHAHTDEAARAAVLAGVRTIEHGTLISASTAELMRDRHTCFIPTLSFWSDMAAPGGHYDDPVLVYRARAMQPRARTAAAQAERAGVLVVAGSDMRYDETSPYRLADEIAALAQSGLSPMAALQSGTSRAAACLGIDKRTGSIKLGMEADIIVVEQNPTDNLATLQDPTMVINDGVIAVDKLSH